jgi:hypothetical protein
VVCDRVFNRLRPRLECYAIVFSTGRDHLLSGRDRVWGGRDRVWGERRSDLEGDLLTVAVALPVR